MRQAIIGFRWNILSIVFPRLCVVGLSVAQPFLVNEAIKFVQSVDGNENVNIGYGLIGAYTFVFIGNAVFESLLHVFNRILTATNRSSGRYRVVPAPFVQTHGDGARWSNRNDLPKDHHIEICKHQRLCSDDLDGNGC